MSEAATTRVISHPAISRGGGALTRSLFSSRRNILEAGRLELPACGVVGIVGINGAGKSTLMLEIAGVLVSRKSKPQRDPVGFSPQRPSFPSWLDCKEIARMFGFEYDALEAAFPALLLDELRNTRGSDLSVGQTQVLSIALALSAGADMTLLDEPFAPLDFRRRVALTQILRAHPGNPHCPTPASVGIVIVSSQSAAELLDVCDWLVVLQSGRYVYSGAISDIIAGARGEAARVLLEDHVMALL